MSCSATKTQGKEKQRGGTLPKQLLHVSYFLPVSQQKGVRGWEGVWLLVVFNSPQIINLLKEIEERTFRDPLHSSLIFQGVDKLFSLRAAAKNNSFPVLEQTNQKTASKYRLTKQLSSAVFTGVLV